jgi:hypothetical protein
MTLLARLLLNATRRAPAARYATRCYTTRPALMMPIKIIQVRKEQRMYHCFHLRVERVAPIQANTLSIRPLSKFNFAHKLKTQPTTPSGPNYGRLHR